MTVRSFSTPTNPTITDAGIVLYGASVRALAFCAWNAGIQPLCVDLFADWDLRHVAGCRVVPLEQYPQAMLDASLHPQGLPWMYSGGLENYPQFLENLAQKAKLLGNHGEVLRGVRDPFLFAELLSKNGFLFPEARTHQQPRPQCGKWLLKSRRSSGGMGVRDWSAGLVDSADYLQAFVEGDSYSASYVGRSEGALLLGITRQLVGEIGCNAPAFSYCGSIGPANLTGPQLNELQRLGDVLAIEVGLRGYFGVDFIINDRGIWLIEVNPRFTASVEILERSARQNSLPLHLAAFGYSAEGEWRPQNENVHGKVILFARESCHVHSDSPCYDNSRPLPARDFADVPMPGQWHEPGQPILTLFADAPSLTECQQVLRQKVRDFQEQWLLFG